LNEKSSPSALLHQVNQANTLQEIIGLQGRLPGLLKSLIDEDATVRYLSGFISNFADTVLKRIICIAIEEMGPAPAKFSFMLMGSTCRREQTLLTDQDNAIVFDDAPADTLQDVRQYFLEFGEKICGWLDEAGYAYCKGDFMAQNPQWCQPLSQWKKYYADWVLGFEPESQVRFGIFFDFRSAHGNEGLIDALRQHLFELLTKSRGFFFHLQEIAMQYKPPLGLFGKLRVGTASGHPDSLDIKSAMEPFVFITRLFAFSEGVEVSNTFERLDQLLEKKAFMKEEHSEIVHAYGFLMRLRLLNQIEEITGKNRPADNFIDPKALSPDDRFLLKESLKVIRKLQRKISTLQIK
jgi:CBS domain-containing protein